MIPVDIRLILLLKTGIYTIVSHIKRGYFYIVHPIMKTKTVTYETCLLSFF
jgi:hypothetical protein